MKGCRVTNEMSGLRFDELTAGLDNVRKGGSSRDAKVLVSVLLVCKKQKLVKERQIIVLVANLGDQAASKMRINLAADYLTGDPHSVFKSVKCLHVPQRAQGPN